MTKDKAIRELEYIKSSFKGNCTTDTLVPISRIEVEALEMAIEALENQKTGHWIADVDKWGGVVTTINGYKCSECGEFNDDKDNYCPNCGAKMIEPQESEE